MSGVAVAVDVEIESRETMRRDEQAWTQLSKQLGASVFFGVSSILIITVNKAVLTTYKYVLRI